MGNLSKPVLVLNKSWTPINTISVERAIIKLSSYYADGEPKAKIIDVESFAHFTWNDWVQCKPKDGEDYIASVNLNLRIPEVIFLTRYNKFPKLKVHFSRAMLFKRDENTCQYCYKKFSTELLNIDHILPRSRGGLTNWCNCCLSCHFCNRKKANRTPLEAGMKLLKEPVAPPLSLFKNEIIKPLKSWSAFISEIYWNIPLQED